jgi:hypothetical protein
MCEREVCDAVTHSSRNLTDQISIVSDRWRCDEFRHIDPAPALFPSFEVRDGLADPLP